MASVHLAATCTSFALRRFNALLVTLLFRHCIARSLPRLFLPPKQSVHKFCGLQTSFSTVCARNSEATSYGVPPEHQYLDLALVSLHKLIEQPDSMPIENWFDTLSVSQLVLRQRMSFIGPRVFVSTHLGILARHKRQKAYSEVL